MDESTAGAPAKHRPMSGFGLVVALAVTVGTVLVANAVFGASDLARALTASSRYTALPQDFMASPPEPAIVFLGDSRTIHGVATDVISTELTRALGRDIVAWDLGVPGGPPLTHLGWSGHLLARERPPEAVVIMLSEYMFGSRLEPTMSREAIPSLWRWQDVPAALLAGMPVEDAAAAGLDDLFAALRQRRGVLARVFDGVPPGPPEALGDRGYKPAGRVDARTQRARAAGRAQGYRKELADASVNEEQLGYFDATLERLVGAGIPVMVVTTPSSSPLWPNHELPVVRAAFDRARDIAAAYGVPFTTYRDSAVVDDFYFSDGDHLTREGGQRYATFLARRVLAPWLAPGAPRWAGRRFADPTPDPGCRVVYDFEELERPREWGFKGTSFRHGPITGAVGTQQDVTGYGGLGLLSSFSPETGDDATGEAGSPRFLIERPELRLLVGGGAAPGVGVALIVDGKVVREARGADSEALVPVSWDVADLVGQEGALRIIDHATGAWGHVMLDEVQSCGRAPR